MRTISEIPKNHNARRALVHAALSTSKLLQKVQPLSQNNPDQATTKVIIIPGAGKSQQFKKWPLESYIKLINEIQNEINTLEILILLGPDEDDIEKIIPQETQKQAQVLKNKTGKELRQIFTPTTVIIAGDTSMAHLAADSGAKILLLAGPSNVKHTAPLSDQLHIIRSHSLPPCAPCITRRNARGCGDNVCMKNIPVDQVLEKLQMIVQKRSELPT